MSQYHSRNADIHSKIPLDIWHVIAEFLTIQDLLNASASCKGWYRSVTTEKLWKAVYRHLMKGYSLDQFVVPDQVKNAKRPKSVQFNPSQTSMPEKLEDWTKSWKQRSVFLNHVMKIQKEVVSALRQKRPEDFITLDAPIYDASRVLRLEENMGAAFPIDFVFFMLHFAHDLSGKDDGSYNPIITLASGNHFREDSRLMEEIRRLQFRKHSTSSNHHTDCDFLAQTKFVCMASPCDVGMEYGQDCLTLLIQNAAEGHDQGPDVFRTHYQMVDYKAIKQGLGKVSVIADIFQSCRRVYCTAQASAISDDQEYEVVVCKTRSLHNLFSMFQACLPVDVHYNRSKHAINHLYTYKYYRDHLACLENHQYKYPEDRLQIIQKRLKKHLLDMSRDYGRPAYLPKDQYGVVVQPKDRYIIDASDISEIDWSRVWASRSEYSIYI